MTPSSQMILSLLAAFGIGSILGNYFQSKFQHTRDLKNKVHKWKRERYGAIIMQILTVLRFNKYGTRFAKEQRPNLNTKNDYLEEIKLEFLHGIVMMSDEVINSLADFLRKEDYDSYSQVVNAMRKDLWGKKSKVDKKTITDIVNIKYI
ncbi:MAG: hypothetical protein R3B41_01260 [Candidatus Doudnabacteria bacterium]